MLSLTSGYLIFTNGVSIRIGTATLPKGATLGRTLRVTLDPASHAARSIELAATAIAPDEVDAAKLPPEYLGGTATLVVPRPDQGKVERVNIVVEVLVPPTTPVTDDIYFTTERTSFSPAEMKMTRIDNLHWSVQLSIERGTIVRYRFTRGSNATAERDAAGTIAEPHQLSAEPSLHTHDTVARWADQT